MRGEYAAESGRFHFFKLWLILFPVLNAIDIVQTWFFFEHETNPLYVLFPDLIFGVKIFWSCFAPLFLYVSYSRKPKIVYSAALALILLYLGIVLFNLFNIVRIVGS
jgi:hypothetical protein